MPLKLRAATRWAVPDLKVSGEAAMAGTEARTTVSTLRSVVSNWAGLVISGVISLVLTPILVHGLGDFYFGMFTLVASLLDSYWLLDFGMRTTIFRFVARYQGSGRRHELDETFASGLAIVLISASAILLLSLAGALALPHFFAMVGRDRMVFGWLLGLSGAALAAAFGAQFLGTYLCAFRRFDLYNLLSVVTGLLRAGLIVLAFRLGMGIRAVALATLVASAGGLLASVRAVGVADPELAVSMKNVYRRRIRELPLQQPRLSRDAGRPVALLRGFGSHRARARRCVDHTVCHSSAAHDALPQLGVALASPMAGMMSEMEGRKAEAESRDYFLFATRMSALLSLFIGLLGDKRAGDYPRVGGAGVPGLLQTAGHPARRAVFDAGAAALGGPAHRQGQTPLPWLVPLPGPGESLSQYLLGTQVRVGGNRVRHYRSHAGGATAGAALVHAAHGIAQPAALSAPRAGTAGVHQRVVSRCVLAGQAVAAHSGRVAASAHPRLAEPALRRVDLGAGPFFLRAPAADREGAGLAPPCRIRGLVLRFASITVSARLMPPRTVIAGPNSLM